MTTPEYLKRLRESLDTPRARKFITSLRTAASVAEVRRRMEESPLGQKTTRLAVAASAAHLDEALALELSEDGEARWLLLENGHLPVEVRDRVWKKLAEATVRDRRKIGRAHPSQPLLYAAECGRLTNAHPVSQFLWSYLREVTDSGKGYGIPKYATAWVLSSLHDLRVSETEELARRMGHDAEFAALLLHRGPSDNIARILLDVASGASTVYQVLVRALSLGPYAALTTRPLDLLLSSVTTPWARPTLRTLLHRFPWDLQQLQGSLPDEFWGVLEVEDWTLVQQDPGHPFHVEALRLRGLAGRPPQRPLAAPALSATPVGLVQLHLP